MKPAATIECRWLGWALNIVPALAAGLLAYLGLARVFVARRSPDFWSLGQLELWPWLAAVAGIVADG